MKLSAKVITIANINGRAYRLSRDSLVSIGWCDTADGPGGRRALLGTGMKSSLTPPSPAFKSLLSSSAGVVRGSKYLMANLDHIVGMNCERVNPPAIDFARWHRARRIWWYSSSAIERQARSILFVDLVVVGWGLAFSALMRQLAKQAADSMAMFPPIAEFVVI